MGGNHIEPDFVETLPERYRFPICKALPYPIYGNLIRCFVTVGADDPVVAESIQTFLLDMPEAVFEKLPSFRE